MKRDMPTANRLIRASAGTGKTYQLSNQYLSLLAGGAPVDRILATTFTRKAAGEILDRVVLRLAEAVIDPNQRTLLARALSLDSLSADESFALLQKVLTNLHRLRICTLDSFFAQMARGLSLELQLSPNWRILEEWQAAALRDRGLDDVLREDSTSRLHSLTHLLTKGEARRGVADLLRRVVHDLHEIFQQTGEKAWHGLRIAPPLGAAELEQALKSFAVAEVDERFRRVRDADLERAQLGDWESFIKKGIAAKIVAGEPTYQRTPIPAETAALYEHLVTHARAVLIARLAQQTQGSYRILKQFDQAYARLKSESSVLRFQDVTQCLASIDDELSQPGARDRRLAFRLDGTVQHLLLDEFQDTSPTQWRALRGLARRVASQREQGSIFCVGDVKQAIYGWRGGVAEIFDAVEAELPDMQVSTLELSYRSAPAVIDTVNRVFSGISQHSNLEKHESAVRAWCSKFPQHSTARTDLAGYACLRTAAIQATAASFSEPALESAVAIVDELLAGSPAVQIGILVRTNDCVGKMIYLLRRQGIRASEEGGNPLTDSAAVNLVLSLMQLADHPGDSVARFHVAASPLGQLLGFVEHGDDGKAEQLSRELRGRLDREGYASIVQQCLHQLNPFISGREKNRLSQLVELAYRFQPHAANRPSEFPQYVMQQRVADPTSANVRVMTVHQAKGLEFDAVVLPELDSELVGQPKSCVVRRSSPAEPIDLVCQYANADIQQLLPQRFQQMFADHGDRMVAESLCLLYVALTRAARALYMIVPAPSPSEKKLPKRFSGLLRAALTDGEPVAGDTLLYEVGDCHWHRDGTAHPSEASTSASPAELLRTPIRFAQRRQRERGLPRVSPSSLEGAGFTTIDSLVRREANTGLNWGSLVHACFESVDWLDEELPDRERLEAACRRVRGDQPSGPADASDVDSFLQLLKKPAVSEVLRRSYYLDGGALGRRSIQSDPTSIELEVRNEYPFAVVDEDHFVSGFIDRLVLIRQAGELVGADVVDFKTDRIGFGSAPSEEEIQEKIAFYRPQIEAYCRAVAKFAHLDARAVTARLVFVTAGKVAELGGRKAN